MLEGCFDRLDNKNKSQNVWASIQFAHHFQFHSLSHSLTHSLSPPIYVAIAAACIRYAVILNTKRFACMNACMATLLSRSCDTRSSKWEGSYRHFTATFPTINSSTESTNSGTAVRVHELDFYIYVFTVGSSAIVVAYSCKLALDFLTINERRKRHNRA